MSYLITHAKREFEVRKSSRAGWPFSLWEVFYKGEKIDGLLQPPAPEGCSSALERHRMGGRWFYAPQAWAFNNRRAVPVSRRMGGRPRKAK